MSNPHIIELERVYFTFHRPPHIWQPNCHRSPIYSFVTSFPSNGKAKKSRSEECNVYQDPAQPMFMESFGMFSWNLNTKTEPDGVKWANPMHKMKESVYFVFAQTSSIEVNVVFVDVNAIVYILFAFISDNMLKVHAKHMPFFTWIHELMLFHHENCLQELEIWFDTAKKHVRHSWSDETKFIETAKALNHFYLCLRALYKLNGWVVRNYMKWYNWYKIGHRSHQSSLERLAIHRQIKPKPTKYTIN